MIIQICGPGCSACERTHEVVRAALRASATEASISTVSDFQEMAKLGIFSTPALLIDGVPRCVGRTPRQDEVEAWLQ